MFARWITSVAWGENALAPPSCSTHLALKFVNNGWSVKQLIRQIVMSRTYQTSSQVEAEQLATDPENRLLSHFPKRRADAEYLRDALLTISGTIDDTKGRERRLSRGTNSEFGYVYTSQRRECLFAGISQQN